MSTEQHENPNSRRGYARAAALSPERRKEIARTAYLTGAVNSVVDRAPELTAQQRDRLLTALRPQRRAGGGR